MCVHLAAHGRTHILMPRLALTVTRCAPDLPSCVLAALQAAPINVPTWTGRSGAGGAPPAIARRFGAATNSRLLPPGPSSGPPVPSMGAPGGSGSPGGGDGGGEPRFGSAAFGAGARAGTRGGVAPRSANLLAALAARRAAVSAAADEDPEVRNSRRLHISVRMHLSSAQLSSGRVGPGHLRQPCMRG